MDETHSILLEAKSLTTCNEAYLFLGRKMDRDVEIEILHVRIH